MGERGYLLWMTVGTVMLGAVGLTGSVIREDGSGLFQRSDRSATVMPAAIAASVISSQPQPEATTVDYQICQELPDWTRPPLETQQQALAEHPRYQEVLRQTSLENLMGEFWTQPIITFTNYGLSARVEPIFLSGLWTVNDAIWSCYEGDQPMAINRGDIAELWLINHEIHQIKWSGDSYQAVVIPSETGVQFIQFQRQENRQELPIQALTIEGDNVPLVSGDW